MSTIETRVTRVAAWAGWCTPCRREDSPLVLTRSGPSGVRAWFAGHGDEDRLLLLTCRVCGTGQVVPVREEDDPEVELPAAVLPLPRTGTPAGALVAAPGGAGPLELSAAG